MIRILTLYSDDDDNNSISNNSHNWLDECLFICASNCVNYNLLTFESQ